MSRATPDDGLDYEFERAMANAMRADRKAAERAARRRRFADPEYRRAIVATKFALKLAGLGNDACAHITIADVRERCS